MGLHLENKVVRRVASDNHPTIISNNPVLRHYIFWGLCVIEFRNFSSFGISHRFQFLSCQYFDFYDLMLLYRKFSGQRSRDTNLSAVSRRGGGECPTFFRARLHTVYAQIITVWQSIRAHGPLTVYCFFSPL